MISDLPHQGPKFYGRRKGRVLSGDLQMAVKAGLRQFGIARQMIEQAEIGSLHPQNFFPSHSPLFTDHFLEIGFGTGDFFAGQAAVHPDIGLIGCEAFENGVAKCLQNLLAQNIRNARIYNDDVRHLLPKLQDGCLRRVFLLFPDPWPKKRHAKRRFISQDNLRELERLIRPGGEFWVATDDATYKEWVREQMTAQSWFRSHHPAILTDTPPQPWFETRYQRKAIRAGRKPEFAVFTRV